MKGTFLKTLTVATLLTAMSPAIVNAATLSADKENQEMKVGQSVYVTVTTENPIQTVQFDLNYDKDKYEYDSTGLETDLKVAGSNLINNNDTVRVSAFATEGETTQKVTLKFNAIKSGESIPFSIDKSKTVELGEDNKEDITNTKIEVKRIIGDTIIEEQDNASEYFDSNGNKINKLPQTNAKKSLGTFENLENSKVIVPYALTNTEERIYLSDVKDEFGSSITTTDMNEQDPVKTGDKFTHPNGTQYTIVIYGDVNCDGSVTTADALTTYRRKDKNGKKLDDIQLRAADVENTKTAVDANIEDAKAIQSSILQARKPQTGTILKEYPAVETYELTLDTPNDKKYAYKKETIAKIAFNSNAVTLEDNLFTFEITKKPAGSDDNSKIVYEKDENGDFLIKLYATSNGSYEITPMVKQGIIAEGHGQTAFTVTIDENKDISKIKLVDENNNELTSLSLKSKEELSVQPKLEFYHQNYDINGQAIGDPIKLTDVNAKNISMTKTNGLESVNLYDNTADGGKPIYGQDLTTTNNTNPINSLFVKADAVYESTTEKVVIKVDNQSIYGTANYEKEIEIQLVPNVESIFMNNEELSKTSEMTLDLFTTMPTKTTTSNGMDIFEDEDEELIYTMIPIKYAGNSKVKWGDIEYPKGNIKPNGEHGKIVINRAEGSNNAIWVAGFVKNGNNYQAVSNSGDPIDYIGIAIDGNPSELAKGLTIVYDKLSVDGKSVVSGKTKININVDPALTISNDENEEDNEISTFSIERADSEETKPLQNNSLKKAPTESDSGKSSETTEQDNKTLREEDTSTDASLGENKITDLPNLSTGGNTTGGTEDSFIENQVN